MAERESGNEGGKASEARGSSPLERPIALFSPLFDLVLWVGDRVSRIAGPVDHESYPGRPRKAEEEAVDREDPEKSGR